MKDFAAGPGRLRVLSTGAKILYSAFAISALIGLLVSWKLYGAIVVDEGPAAYYAGGSSIAAPRPSAKPSAEPAANDGPEIELAPVQKEEARSHVIVERISDRKLLEVTHFHLFSIPVYVLILAHLWLLARVPPWAHTLGTVASVVTSALHVAAPWIVRGQPGIAWLMPLSGIAMLLALGSISVISIIDMWLPPKRATA